MKRRLLVTQATIDFGHYEHATHYGDTEEADETHSTD
jgi:hypothetical protein